MKAPIRVGNVKSRFFLECNHLLLFITDTKLYYYNQLQLLHHFDFVRTNDTLQCFTSFMSIVFYVSFTAFYKTNIANTDDKNPEYHNLTLTLNLTMADYIAIFTLP